MNFTAGSLVKARGREWVVLPESKGDLLVLRPLGGTEEEVAGVYIPLETVESARFDLPDPTHVGDHRSCRLLRDAVRLSSRAGAGPFRSFARIAVEPRPYQLVPLLVALKLNPIRLLIADDVGIGKTIEACLVAREMLDRGEVNRLAVLCPPHLAEQWQAELRDKFHIEAELVLPSTAARLERGTRVGQSLFDYHPFVVVSMDFIKSDKRRDDFARSCPELVIVDEAHTCAFGHEGRGGRHQRHDLVKQLASSSDRHMIFVTATPHSGKEEAFRSLLSLIKSDFASLPEDLSGPQNAAHRRKLAAHFVQRRRADIRHFMKEDTPFPDREDAEKTYQLTPEYQKLFDRVLTYTRETVRDPAGGLHRQRVRWWSALALLRSLASSPAAAASTLRNRAACADTASADEADQLGWRTVLDQDIEDEIEGVDVTAGADPGDEDSESGKSRRRLLDMAREAEKLRGDKDAKLLEAVKLINQFLRDGYRPILFCRFIPTSDYLALELRKRLPKDVEVVSVTGVLPPSDREARVLDLCKSPRRVLVCTDCLSEGINLQDHFDAVMHYDLSWSPTRHEQREGRVDRFGQKRRKVRVLTYYGTDNQIDGIVLNVLLRKHKTIRNSLGISVPVPVDTNTVFEAIFEGLLLKEKGGTGQQVLPELEEYLKPKKQELDTEWDRAADREKRSRTMFAQESIKVDEVARELTESRAAAGTPDDVREFTRDAMKAYKAVETLRGDAYHFDIRETPRALRDAIAASVHDGDGFTARFNLVSGDEKNAKNETIYIGRTHPVVESVASHLMDGALDPLRQKEAVARRAGAIRTRAVSLRTTLILARYRYDITTRRSGKQSSQIAEECRLLGFTGAPGSAEWIDEEAVEKLLAAEPHGNIPSEQAAAFITRVVEGFESLLPHIQQDAKRRSRVLLDSHSRVRAAAQMRGVAYAVAPKLPPDIIGIYVLLPAGEA